MPPDLFPHDSSFGDLLRTQRRASGLTQAELAERAGLSVRGLSDLERGVRTRPQRETVQRLLAALDAAPEERSALQRMARRVPPGGAPHREHSGRVPVRAIPPGGGKLFGRSAVLESLRAWLLEPSPGIVTLIGPGGSGKTRLALAIASDDAVMQRCLDGVVVADLSAVRDAQQVLPAIAVALGWVESATHWTVQTVAERLQGQRLCLVLDNFEQVIDAAADVARLAALLPASSFLVTSRQPLMVRAERCLPVAPLPVPVDVDVQPSAVMSYPAVQLFAQRARAANPSFVVTDANARDVSTLCQRLDGLPLALELAASLTSTLSPAMLLRRLEERAALPGSLRDLPERQRTLENVVAWSEALLTAEERAMFHLLAVFDGSFSLNAVRYVWRASGEDPTPDGDASDLDMLLGSLVQRSLLQRDGVAGDEARFRLLETIRAVAAARLRSSPQRERVYAAHAQAMQQAAETAQLWQRDVGFDARLRRLERDLPNLRVALGWLTAHNVPGAARLLDTLGSFWALCGYGPEGLAQCETVLARHPEPDLLRCRLLRHAAWIATNLGELGCARQHIGEASHLAEALGDEREAAFVRFVRGNIAQGLGNPVEAEREIERALQVFQDLDEGWATFACNAVLGMVAIDRGDAAQAEARYAAALRSASPGIAPRDRATALCNIAVAQRWQGRMEDAVTNAARALALSEGIVAWSIRAGAWQVLARGALQQGDLAAARHGLRESLRHWQRSGDQRGLAACLEVTASYTATRGGAEMAATLLAAVSALREQVGPGSVLASAERTRLEATLRGELSVTAFAVATERGRFLSLPQALALAHTMLDHPA